MLKQVIQNYDTILKVIDLKRGVSTKALWDYTIIIERNLEYI